MNKPLKELTNIGVPIYDPLRIWIQEMTLACSDHKGKTIKLEREIRQEVIDRVDKIVDKQSANKTRDYLTYINFYANNNSISEFNITNNDRIINIFRNLLGEERLNAKTEEEILKKLEKEKELLFSLINYISNTKYTKEIYKSIKEYSELYYGKKNQDLRSYLKVEKKYYDNAYGKLNELKKIDYTDLLEDYTDDLNPEKVSLYLANSYLNEIYEAIIVNDISKIQECMFYLTAFIRKRIDKSIKLFLDKEVSYDIIKKEYENILIKYPSIREIKEKRRLFENKDLETNKKVIESLLNIKKLSIPGKIVKPGDMVEIKYTDGTHKRNNTPPTEEELKEIDEYLDYKYYEFLKHNPILQIDGTDRFSNYKVFLYENGMMPADRFLNVNTISQMKADSIYIFDASNIKERIYLDKTTLRRISEIKPLNHSGNWEERLELIANQETNNELKEKAKQLVKEN